MLEAIHRVPVTIHQKLRLYKQGMCPCLSWAFLVEDFPISFFIKEIQPLATHFFKKWSGLARSANTSLLFLPRRSGGLGLPSLTLLYKKQQVSLQAQLRSSRDRAVRNIAQCQLQRQKGMIRQAFKPAVVVESVLEGNPSLSRKALVRVSRKQKTSLPVFQLSLNRAE